MGYQTYFSGGFDCEPPLSEEQVAYLQAFNGTRRMQRDAAKAATLPDPLREAIGLPIGYEGAYYVGSFTDGIFGQGDDDSILNHNNPAGGPTWGYADPIKREGDFGPLKRHAQSQPGLWCQWTTHDGLEIVWDENEKFYDYVAWLVYIVKHFLEPWEVKLNGTVQWDGEESDDVGQIGAGQDGIYVQEGIMSYGPRKLVS